MLVPLAVFQDDLREAEPTASATARLARQFNVSGRVILRRLREAGRFRGWDEFRTAYETELDRLKDVTPDKAGCGDFYRTLGVRVSHRFEYAVVADTLNGRTAFREGMRLLGLKKMATFDNLAKEFGVQR